MGAWVLLLSALFVVVNLKMAVYIAYIAYIVE